MKFTIKSEKPAEASSGCVILGVFEEHKLSAAAIQFDKATGGLLSKLVKDGDIDGNCGKTLLIHYPEGARCDRVMLVGCGKESEFNEERYCKAVASTARTANACGATDALSYLTDLKVNKRDGYWKIRTLVEHTEGVRPWRAALNWHARWATCQVISVHRPTLRPRHANLAEPGIQ